MLLSHKYPDAEPFRDQVTRVNAINVYQWLRESYVIYNPDAKMSDFPYALSPFDAAWMEWGQDGVYLECRRADSDFEGNPCSWVMGFRCFTEFDGALEPVSAGEVAISDDGSLANNSHPFCYNECWTDATRRWLDDLGEDTDSAAKSCTVVCLTVVCAAMSFMHCKNVEIVEQVPPRPTRRRFEREGRPIIKYKTLDVGALRQQARTDKSDDENEVSRALHICRGHFATYTEDAPLFGRITGTFWKPMHVRGSKKNGEVIKDYRIKAEGAA